MEVQFIDDTSDICCCEGFIMRRGVSDLYVYVILEGISTSGDIHMKQTRVVCRPNGNQFSYGYVTDDMQGEMPSVATMKWLNQNAATQKTQDAAYRLQDGSIWMITSSLEYQNGGPLKQNLTTHMDTRSPVICTSLSSEHFGSSPVY